jgi:hypothetical protein
MKDLENEDSQEAAGPAENTHDHKQPSAQNKLKVTVDYPPAEEPFKDDDADPSETVGHLKARVLLAFGLEEGQTPDGNMIVYTLYNKKQPLENPAQTLAELSGNQKVLQLKLSQQITQGR